MVINDLSFTSHKWYRCVTHNVIWVRNFCFRVRFRVDGCCTQFDRKIFCCGRGWPQPFGLYSMYHDAFSALIKPSPNIDHYMPNIWPWTLTLASSIDLDLKARSKSNKNAICHAWPWPLTYGLDLQSQSRLGQGHLPCQNQGQRSNDSSWRA